MVALDFFQAYALTIAVETAALYILMRKEAAARAIVRNSFIASTLTLPFVWFVFPYFGLGYNAQIAFSELFAFGAEAAVYASLFRIGLGRAALISFLCNALSFCAGLALMMI